MRHIYGLDAQDAVTKPGIYFQLRLFTVASKYDVQTLLKMAVTAVDTHFAQSNIVQASWSCDVVYKIYEELPVHKRELRIVARACVMSNTRSYSRGKSSWSCFWTVRLWGWRLGRRWRVAVRTRDPQGKRVYNIRPSNTGQVKRGTPNIDARDRIAVDSKIVLCSAEQCLRQTSRHHATVTYARLGLIQLIDTRETEK